MEDNSPADVYIKKGIIERIIPFFLLKEVKYSKLNWCLFFFSFILYIRTVKLISSFLHVLDELYHSFQMWIMLKKKKNVQHKNLIFSHKSIIEDMFFFRRVTCSGPKIWITALLLLIKQITKQSNFVKTILSKEIYKQIKTI
jgi:hypothetical protein